MVNDIENDQANMTSMTHTLLELLPHAISWFYKIKAFPCLSVEISVTSFPLQNFPYGDYYDFQEFS